MKTIGEAAAVLLIGAALAGADQSSFRCGSKLVLVGATKQEVLGSCGTPAGQEPGATVTTRGKGSGEEQSTVVTVETWTYDRGTNELVAVLTFKNGRLDTIASGGYGTPRK